MSRIAKALEQAMKQVEGNQHLSDGAPDDRANEKKTARVVQIFSSDAKATGVPSPSSGKNIDKSDLKNASPFLRAMFDDNSPYAESYRMIRSQLLSLTDQNEGHTILVASAAMGEGKTITAVNLAALLAKSVDHTVLIVDADLRRPNVAKCMGVETDKGLSDYLSGSVSDLSEILAPTGLGKLVLLPAGRPTPKTSELLTSMKMKKLLEELKQRYQDRYIIIDSGPLLAASETATLASWVDGVVFVVEEGKMSQRTVEKGFSLIKNCNVFGVVINKADPHSATNLKAGRHYYK